MYDTVNSINDIKNEKNGTALCDTLQKQGIAKYEEAAKKTSGNQDLSKLFTDLQSKNKDTFDKLCNGNVPPTDLEKPIKQLFVEETALIKTYNRKADDN